MRIALPEELRALVRQAVALLGEVIRVELGEEPYRMIEELRQQMASLRGSSDEEADRMLRTSLAGLERLNAKARYDVAVSYTLMLEVMNSCENAYRTFRLSQSESSWSARPPEGIIYVLTAHPTEARSPENIQVFHWLQEALVAALRQGFERQSHRIRHLLELAWRVPVARPRKPTVEDEADHIYSTLLREETLRTLLDINGEGVPTYIRSWVGGDKDGHPGVTEKEMLASLGISRCHILQFAQQELMTVRQGLKLAGCEELDRECARVAKVLNGLKLLKSGDAARVEQLRRLLKSLVKRYADTIHQVAPELTRLQLLLKVFPGLVVPLELREASDVLMQATGRPAGTRPAIAKMVAALRGLSRGGDPRWYARGFVISMASRLEHVLAAATLLKKELGSLGIPIVPLFEQKSALEQAPKVVSGMLHHPELRKSMDRFWGGALELMVGYSDSAKESGVLASRVAIAEALEVLDRLMEREGVKPIFFHGSGGSIDRGGGSIAEQTAWWPAGALRLYKATIQGEMVERSMASPEITRGQIFRIAESLSQARLSVEPASRARVRLFSERVAEEYRKTVADEQFLELVQKATPYPFLNVLRIGSRPSKRNTITSVDALRAIPWVLCWTQTRVLFPTWWGVGTAWNGANTELRGALKRAFEKDPLFRSFVQALGFTLAKVELPVFRLYLETSQLPEPRIAELMSRFQQEYRWACDLVRAISGQDDLLWFRPWLGSSVNLRSPMIHPLNLLQILALRDQDLPLIRLTVTGVASGMMTTG